MTTNNIGGAGYPARVTTILLYVLLIVTPVVVTVGLLRAVHGVGMTELMPAGPDDVFYWHEPAAFAKVGLSGGYTSPAEKLPPASFSRFGPWGPVTTIVYGAFALVGWPYYAVPVVNLLLLTISIAVLIVATRPTLGQTAALIVIMATFSATVIHGPTTMQVIFQLALATSAAAGFMYLIEDMRGGWPRRYRLPARLALAALIFVMSLSKVTWAVLWIPYFLLILPAFRFRGLILSFAVSGVLAVFAALFYRWTAAPYPYAIAQAGTGISAAVDTLWRTVTSNLAMFNTGHPLEIHMRWLTVGLILITFAILIVRRHTGRDRINTVAALTAFSLAVTLVATVLLYEVHFFRDYRVLSAVVLMTIIMIVLTHKRWMIAAVCLAQIVAVPWALDFYAESTAIHVSERIDRQVERWQPALAEHIVFKPDAPSPWCNTVLVSTPYIFDRVGVAIAVDERVGLSLLTLEGSFDFPVKSAYLLLDDAILAHIGYQLRIEPLLDIPEGKLYRNLDANCG